MVELSPGTGVYGYPYQLAEAAKQKKNLTEVPAYLLSCFYTGEELLEKGIINRDLYVPVLHYVWG